MRLLFITVQMVKILRFLQSRPYWLYKVSVVLVVVADALTVVYAGLAWNETIVYPLIVSLLPANFYALGIALLTLLGESVIFITRKPRNSVWRHLGFGVLIFGFGVLSIAIMGPYIVESNPRAHVMGIWHNDHMYNLAQDGYGIVNFATIHPHALYECDGYGLICRKLDRFDLATEIWIPPPHHTTVIELVADAEANTISVLVDGELMYTYEV